MKLNAALVKQIGGVLDIGQADYDQGTRFSVRFPLQLKAVRWHSIRQRAVNKAPLWLNPLRDPLIKIFRACAGQATWSSHAAFFFLDRYEGNHREYSCNKPARRCRDRIPKSASTLFAYIFGIAHRMSQHTGQWRSGAGMLGRCKASKPRPAPLL